MTDIPSGAHPSPAIIADATRRAGLIWIAVPGHGRPRPAWHVWCTPGGREVAGAGRGAAYVLTGPGEQPVPGLAGASRAQVTVPTGQAGPASRARPGAAAQSATGLVTWTADVGRVEPGSQEWDGVIGALLAGRLNPAPPQAPEPPAGLPLAQRWARTCTVVRLAPTAG